MKKTLSDTVLEKLRRDIMEQNLKPGEKIDVKELAERYGTSVTPVKVALNRLISDRLIENYPRQGMYVKAVEHQELFDIFEIREMLDLFYMEEVLTAVHHSATLMDALKKNVETHLTLVRSMSEDTDVDAHLDSYQLDFAFHELYLKCSGNKKAVEIFHSIHPFLYSYFIFNKQSPKKSLDGVLEHQAILNALQSENVAALRHAIQTHYANMKRVVDLIMKVQDLL